MAVTPDDIASYQASDFGTFQDLVALQARATPNAIAVLCGTDTVSYAALDGQADQVAAGLQRDGVRPGDVVAVCAATSIIYTSLFVGILRSGATISPLPPSAAPAQLAAMLADSRATHLFMDAEAREHLTPVNSAIDARSIVIDDPGVTNGMNDWLPEPGVVPRAVAISPDQAFNIIYSSGTTGTPKGIVQPYSMRWNHVGRLGGYGPGTVTLISTGLYSNTTLVSFLPVLATGGTLVIMPRFSPRGFLELCEQYRVNFAMLVPIQYRRILDVPDFDNFDLSSFVLKFATSAPFAAELKAEVLRRWPGGLIEWYGMTEGGGSCELVAHEHPDKLHTVGRPMPGHEMFVIDEAGKRLPPNRIGEVVGRSAAMMSGYYNKPDGTSEAEWFNAEGERFIRTGDLASIDEDGFFTLAGRKKDLIISGGFNIYPVDLEAALLTNPAVLEVAVIGAPSAKWGETPVAFVALRAGHQMTEEALREDANARLGKVQRLAQVYILPALPRNVIGKILKRDLHELLPASML